MVGVRARFGAPLEEHLEGPQGPGVLPVPDDPHGELPAGEEGFHENGLPVLPEHPRADFPEIVRRLDPGTGADALARPFRHGLGKEREGKIHLRDVGRFPDDDEGRRRNPAVPDHVLRHPLVEGQGEDQGVGEGVGNVVCLEEGRDLGFPPEPGHSLGDIENEVPAVAPGEAAHQALHMPDPVRFVAQFPEASLDGLDGVLPVELGRLLVAHPEGDVVGLEIVGQPDPHGSV